MILDRRSCGTLFLLFVLLRWPFNWRTPVGYLITLSIQCVAIYATVFCAIPLVHLFIGTLWLSISFVEDVTNDLQFLTVDQSSNQNYMESRQHFCNIVHFYGNAKQLSSSNRNNSKKKPLRRFSHWLLSRLMSDDICASNRSRAHPEGRGP